MKIYKDQTKDRNIITAIINTLAPSLAEEGTRTIEDLKRLMVFLGGRKQKCYSIKKKKNIFQGRLPTTLLKIERLVVFKKTMENLKQMILKKDEAMQHFMIKVNKYKRINVQTLQSQVLDSVENDETHEETQD